MRIAYYCQHVLGIGHFHRSLEICRKISESHTVFMITGGGPLDLTDEKISVFQLPGLMMDSQFNNLAPVDSSKGLEEVKELRKEKLYSFFETFRPQIFLVELYPFGRKSFRFELDPVLQEVKSGQLAPCLTLCSLRDILVERHDKEKFERRIITTLNTLFDGLLIHGDEDFIKLDETFSRVEDIEIPLVYTGYVTPAIEQVNRDERRNNLGISPKRRLVVASIGGGNVGSDLLLATIQAFRHLNEDNLQLQIFAGPYIDDDVYEDLLACSGRGVKVERFSAHFTDWLAAADLSISMAGYNTTMNTIAAGVPALFYPFRQNQEQLLRIKKLENRLPFTVLDDDDLRPTLLAKLIHKQLKKKRFTSPIDLGGAARTAELVDQWHKIVRSK